ncbi:UNVERIFIED_CONTAM: hypothetical protein GTU68_005118 [Idotea baltica]|nr:hypothetical protein [Idotea baltica]
MFGLRDGGFAQARWYQRPRADDPPCGPLQSMGRVWHRQCARRIMMLRRNTALK